VCGLCNHKSIHSETFVSICTAVPPISPPDRMMKNSDPAKSGVEVTTTTPIPDTKHRQRASSSWLPAKGSIIPLVFTFCLAVAVSVGIGVVLNLHEFPTETKETETCCETSLTTVEKRERYALTTFDNRYVGTSDSIMGKINPDLIVSPDTTHLVIDLTNGEDLAHDIAVEGLIQDTVQSKMLSTKGDKTTLVIDLRSEILHVREFAYYCTVIGHRADGMEGTIKVQTDILHTTSEPQKLRKASKPESSTNVKMNLRSPNVVRDPSSIPAPLNRKGGKLVRVTLVLKEITAYLDGVGTFDFFAYNGTVPGPMIRVVVGDTVELTLVNPAENIHKHSIDLHAVEGPGGGATLSQTLPGKSSTFRFKALHDGLYVYHCASPHVPSHISHGQYGMILVEPEGGLPPVDREFYVMQGEMYSKHKVDGTTKITTDVTRLSQEWASHVVFNGHTDALTKIAPMHAKLGETIRVYFGVGGPNLISSFHIIGTVFTKVYSEGSLLAPPLTNVQTTVVAPGGSTVVEVKAYKEGNMILVDHALGRAFDKGCLGYIKIAADPKKNTDSIYSAVV